LILKIIKGDLSISINTCFVSEKNKFDNTDAIKYEINVDTAAPKAPYAGIKIIFKTRLLKSPERSR
jgi:hypothetical protein